MIAPAARLLLAAAVLACASWALPGAAAAGLRGLKVTASDDGQMSVTVPYTGPMEYSEYGPLGYIPDPPLTSPWLARNVTGIMPEQIHVTNWGNGSLLFSWATGESSVGTDVTPANPSTVGSWVMWGTQPAQYTLNATSNNSLVYTYTYTNASLDQMSYASPILHHVLVTGLPAGQAIYYVVGDPTLGGLSEEHSVTVPPEATVDNLPFRIGVIADVGITLNSSDTLAHLAANQPQLVWLIGDVCYADQYLSNGTHTPKGYPTDYHTYQPIWDSWSRLIEPLAASVPWNLIQGNHEIEGQLYNGTSVVPVFTSMNARFPAPQNTSMVNTSPGQASFEPTLNDFHPEGSTPNGFYSQDIPGAHVVWLNAHIPWDEGSPQYDFFMADMAAVDRQRTPWLLINIHVPYYGTDVDQYMVNEAMRQLYEPLFYQYGVDIVLSGHVHSYERTRPMFNYTVDECGPVHLTVGDGGNVEGLASEFVDVNPPSFCQDPSSYSKPWFIYAPNDESVLAYPFDGKPCPTSQPDWSAYREPSFGHGILTIQTPSTALWEWHHNQGDASQPTDTVTLSRAKDEACAAKRAAMAKGKGH